MNALFVTVFCALLGASYAGNCDTVKIKTTDDPENFYTLNSWQGDIADPDQCVTMGQECNAPAPTCLQVKPPSASKLVNLCVEVKNAEEVEFQWRKKGKGKFSKNKKTLGGDCQKFRKVCWDKDSVNNVEQVRICPVQDTACKPEDIKIKNAMVAMCE